MEWKPKNWRFQKGCFFQKLGFGWCRPSLLIVGGVIFLWKDRHFPSVRLTSFCRDFLILVGKKWHANCSKFNRNLMWNLLYGCIRGLSLSRWCCFVLEFSISFFWMFLEYKVSKKQGSGKAHIRNLPPTKGQNTSLEREVPWVHSCRQGLRGATCTLRCGNH